jgi:hypothetical protein
MGSERGSILGCGAFETNHSFYWRVIPMVRCRPLGKLAKITIPEKIFIAQNVDKKQVYAAGAGS